MNLLLDESSRNRSVSGGENGVFASDLVSMRQVVSAAPV